MISKFQHQKGNNKGIFVNQIKRVKKNMPRIKERKSKLHPG